MTRVAIIAALEREVAPLVAEKRWQRDPKPHPKGVFVWTTENAVLALAGMGGHRAALAVEAALATGPISEIISAGWAGACAPGAQVGSVARPLTVVDVRTGERFLCQNGDGSVLATVASFATPAEKLRLHAAYGASVVEMEAATVARLAQAHGLPFSALKAVSDGADFELQGIERFHTADGQFREAAFALYAAFRPWLWRPVVKMAKGSKLAAGNLCREIDLLIQGR
jgi:adenosylhomocysteine nucleosidase